MPSFSIAIIEKLRGANGSPSTSTTLAVTRGPRPVFSARTRSPGSAPPASATGNSRRSFFSTPCSHSRPPASCSTPSIISSPRASVFIGCAIQPLPTSSVRPRKRSPMPSAPLRDFSRTRSLGGGVSACQLSGTAHTLPPSSASTTRSTVTLGSPPILWNARPGALSISPSSAMSFNSAFRAILSAPCSPKARAISRLPAGVSEVVMKSSTCFLEGRPGLVLGRGIDER